MKTQSLVFSLIFLLLLSSFSLATVEGNPALADIGKDQGLLANQQQLLTGSQGTADELALENEFFQSIVNTISPLITKLSLLVGGLFGIYLLLLIVRVYYERKNLKLLMDIRFLLDQQNKKLHLPTSQVRRPWMVKLFSWLGGKIRSLFVSVFSPRKKTPIKSMKQDEQNKRI